MVAATMNDAGLADIASLRGEVRRCLSPTQRQFRFAVAAAGTDVPCYSFIAPGMRVNTTCRVMRCGAPAGRRNGSPSSTSSIGNKRTCPIRSRSRMTENGTKPLSRAVTDHTATLPHPLQHGLVIETISRLLVTSAGFVPPVFPMRRNARWLLRPARADDPGGERDLA